jgi:hypothetical protein
MIGDFPKHDTIIKDMPLVVFLQGLALTWADLPEGNTAAKTATVTGRFDAICRYLGISERVGVSPEKTTKIPETYNAFRAVVHGEGVVIGTTTLTEIRRHTHLRQIRDLWRDFMELPPK